MCLPPAAMRWSLICDDNNSRYYSLVFRVLVDYSDLIIKSLVCMWQMHQPNSVRHIPGLFRRKLLPLFQDHIRRWLQNSTVHCIQLLFQDLQSIQSLRRKRSNSTNFKFVLGLKFLSSMLLRQPCLEMKCYQSFYLGRSNHFQKHTYAKTRL